MWIKPRIVVIDESQNWDKELVQIAGSISGIYIYDANKQVYACEIFPSYELHPLDFKTGNPVSDATNDEIYDVWLSNSQNVIYMHCSRVDEMNTLELKAVQCTEISYDECWNAILGEYNANYPCDPNVKQ